MQQDTNEIEVTDPQNMTIWGHSERSGIPPMGLVEENMSKSATTRESKVFDLHARVEDECATHKESSPPSNDQGFNSEADLAIPLCQRCTCEKCKKLQERAKRKRDKRSSLETVARLFPRPDLINILDKYWEILKVHGLFADQSREPFQ